MRIMYMELEMLKIVSFWKLLQNARLLIINKLWVK